jgi:hypothetical protein
MLRSRDGISGYSDQQKGPVAAGRPSVLTIHIIDRGCCPLMHASCYVDRVAGSRTLVERDVLVLLDYLILKS